MQKFIAKYGTAAHLALLAVAPQCLYPFFGVRAIIAVMLWLSVIAAVWLLHEPSVHAGERIMEARARVSRTIMRDPLFWILVAVVVVTGMTWMNSGIEFVYDAETSVWRLEAPPAPFLPGSSRSSGLLPFAAAISMLVVVIGLRHAVGLAGRMAFMLIASTLAAVSAFYLVIRAHEGVVPVISGIVYGIMLIAALSVLPTAFERGWNMAMPLVIVAIAGNLAGVVAFAPARVSAMFGLTAVPVIGYSFVYMMRHIRGTADFKLLVAVSIALTIGGFTVVALLPSVTSGLIETYTKGDFLPESMMKTRAVLSSISKATWMEYPWAGSGTGTFPFDIRFHAVASDWAVIPFGTVAPPHGWWFVLAEGGIIRLAVIILPLCFLVFTYFRRAIAIVRVRELPHPVAIAGPFLLATVVIAEFFGCDFSSLGMETMVGAVLVAAAAAFPVLKKRSENGR